MIASIRGEVVEKNGDNIVVMVGGVGFRIFVPVTEVDTAQIGEIIYLHTQLIVREDALTLYGFQMEEGRFFFNLLLTVNGVGPRIALAILSTMSIDAIRRAVVAEQADLFARVPGVGKKTAQKILLQLQDKVKDTSGLSQIDRFTEVDTDLVAALTSLGYSIVESQTAIQSIPKDSPEDLSSRLRLALQYFSK